MADRDTVRKALLALAADAGDGRHMALFGEGNVSGSLDEARFLVKASGTCLATLQPEHLVEVQAAPLLDAMADEREQADEAIEQLLLEARVDPATLKPSVESLFHAWLLTLPGVRFVAHVHAVAINQILCSPQAQAFAEQRLFPDQVVYCGAASVLVPYVDPGLVLARRIAAEVEAFRAEKGTVPKTILLQNHGLIALGGTSDEARAALGMAEKAAQVFVGAAALGGPIFMAPHQVARIAGREDEHYRQRMLGEGL